MFIYIHIYIHKHLSIYPYLIICIYILLDLLLYYSYLQNLYEHQDQSVPLREKEAELQPG